MAHAQGALLLVDNSIMSPVLSRPLELGAGLLNFFNTLLTHRYNSKELLLSTLVIELGLGYLDIVMHSATKFIAGHSDLMAGVLSVKGEQYVLLFCLLSSV